MDTIYATFYSLLFAASILTLHNLRTLLLTQKQVKVSPISINVYKKYVCIYALISLSDWIPNSYSFTFWTLRGYDHQTISYFYITSILGSTFASFWFGKVLDNYGRKFGCLLYLVLAILSNLLKIVDEPVIITIGQFLNGIGNAALYTSFEAWLVGYYSLKQLAGYSLTPISDVYAVNTLLSAIGAIMSGLLAHNLESNFGLTAPFFAAIILLIVPFYMIWHYWPEHKSEQILLDPKPMTINSKPKQLFYIVGFAQLAMETCLNIVILIWTPTLSKLYPEKFNFGLVFSTMMAGLMFGSQLFQAFLRFGIQNQRILLASSIFSMVAFVVCYLSKVPILTVIQCQFPGFHIV